MPTGLHNTSGVPASRKIEIIQRRNMQDTTYHRFVKILNFFLWRGKLIGRENLPQKGPAVLISNHLSSTGPIACLCTIPLRMYPWSIRDMMDPKLAPAYMSMDFTEKELHLKPPLSTFLSTVICRMTVPVFWRMGCIPVNKGGGVHRAAGYPAPEHGPPAAGKITDHLPRRPGAGAK
jgi:hypothetical protein